MSNGDPLNERVIRLETAVAHLQHELEQMHEVLLAQNAERETLRKQIERLEGRLEQSEQGPEVRDAESERPPHY